MIHKDSKLELEKHLFAGCRIIELGDQLCDWDKESQGIRSDVYFNSIGYSVVSIDWHGNNNVLKLDLNNIIDLGLQADILTDFGTIEHVENFYSAIVNCHNFTKTNGVMIHVNPDKTYADHGYRYFTELFWAELGRICKYETLSIYSLPPYEASNPALEVYAVLRKTESSVLPTEKEFNKLIKYTGPNNGPETQRH